MLGITVEDTNMDQRINNRYYQARKIEVVRAHSNTKG